MRTNELQTVGGGTASVRLSHILRLSFHPFVTSRKSCQPIKPVPSMANHSSAYECLFNGRHIFFVLDQDHRLWIRASDVVDILQFSVAEKAVSRNVDAVDRKTYEDISLRFSNLGGSPSLSAHALFVSENGLLALAQAARAPLSKSFGKWIMNQFLPMVRAATERDLRSQLEPVLAEDVYWRADAEKKLEQMRGELERLRHDSETKDTTIDQLTRNFNALTSVSQAVKRDNEAKEAVVDGLRRNVQVLTETSEALKRDNVAKCAAIQQLTENFQMLNMTNDAMRREIFTNGSYIGALESKVQFLGRAIGTLTKNVTTKSEEDDDLQKQQVVIMKLNDPNGEYQYVGIRAQKVNVPKQVKNIREKHPNAVEILRATTESSAVGAFNAIKHELERVLTFKRNYFKISDLEYTEEELLADIQRICGENKNDNEEQM